MTMDNKGVRAFGQSKQPPKTSNLSKWNEGISQQKNVSCTPINVQMIPIALVKLDPTNARTSTLSRYEISQGPKLPTADFDEDAQKQFQVATESFFQNDPDKDNKAAEYFSLALLASSIKSPENLINPVTVYMKEMDFYLVAGHRRTLAHILLGAEHIAAKILPGNPSLLEHSLIQWKENQDREDLTLTDEINNISSVIRIWEGNFNQKMSVRKLMTVLNLRKTKAASYLAVAKEFNSNQLLQTAIKQGTLTSLELAYNIVTMENKLYCDEILNELIAGTKCTYSQLMAKIKNPDISVRSPDTQNHVKKHGLSLTRNTNTRTISKIIKLIIKSPELKSHHNDFAKINVNSKQGIIAAWEKIFELLDE